MMSESLVWFLRFAEFSALLYLSLIGAYTIGWIKLINKTKKPGIPPTGVSVVVACRNEANNIVNLLVSMSNQHNTNFFIEYLVVDDHSEDETASIAQQWINKHPETEFRLLKAKGYGKKEAIEQAVSQAKGQFILVTDADCRPAAGWVNSILQGFENESVKMVLGPVKLHPAHNFFEQMQALEFSSLIGSAAGAAALGIPSMANGANMAFCKDAFEAVSAQRSDDTYASGDDMFLMGAIARRYGRKSITFVASEGAIVETNAEKNLKSFLRQRIRWASKSGGYNHIFTIAPAWIVLVFNVLLFCLMAASFFNAIFIPLMLLFLLLKLLTDLPLLQRVTTFLGQRKTMKYFLLLSLLYPVYVVGVVVAGMVFNVSWKGRKVIKTV